MALSGIEAKIYAELAIANAYGKPIKNTVAITTGGKTVEYHLVEQAPPNSSGYQGYVYQNSETKQYYLVHEGAVTPGKGHGNEAIKDYILNVTASLASGKPQSQFNDAYNFLKNAVNKYGRNIIQIGQSLGAYHSEVFGATNEFKDIQTYTFNAVGPGTSIEAVKEFLEQHKLSLSGDYSNIQNYRYNTEVVSFIAPHFGTMYTLDNYINEIEGPEKFHNMQVYINDKNQLDFRLDENFSIIQTCLNGAYTLSIIPTESGLQAILSVNGLLIMQEADLILKAISAIMQSASDDDYEDTLVLKGYISMDDNLYEIKAGDTVWDLCQKYDTTYDELIELNEWLAERFSEDREFCLIRPGEKIKIPYGSLELLGERPSFDKGFGNATSAKPIVDPMFLDLNNDGVIGTTSVSNGRYFDHEGDGYGELSSWVDKEDGVLVIDKNNDGVINNGNEIFGDNYIKSNGVKASNGFDALRDLDSNNDGVINSLDERFSELRILKGSGEIVSLEDVGITSISLDKVSVGVVDGNGNTLVYGGSFVREDGSIGNLGTFNIQVDKVLSEEVNKVTVSDDVKVLPDIRGYGVVHSLHQAIMLDNSGVLKGLVNDFINEEDINEKKDIVKRILNKWAGVENISDGSRGQYYDAKRLGVLEKFMGYGFVGENGSRNPNNSAGYYLEDSYASLYNHIYAQLEAQTALKDVFDLIDKVYDFETEEVSYDLSRVIGYIDSVIKEDEMKGKLLLGDFTNSFAHLWLKNNSNYTDYVEHFSSLGEEYDLIVRYTTSKGIIYGTNDADSITGGVEYEAVFGGDGNDTIRTNGGKDFIYGGDGDDYIEGGVNSDIIYGGSGNDSIYGGDGNDSIYGGDGDDFIDPGPTGHDKVYGGAGNDTIRNTTFQHGEPLYLDGGDGDDLIVGNAGNDTLIGGAGNDTIQTQGGNDFVYGGDGNDSIDVSGGNHTVDGGDGNDTIIYRGYSGHSTIAGGKGDDSISASLENYAPSGSHIEMTYRYNLGDGNDTIKTSQTSNTIEFGEGITKENIYFSGDKYDLVISFNNSEGSIRIQNGIASEIINKYIFSNGLTLNHQNITGMLTTKGTEGDDIITGSNKNDRIYGYGGNDTINGNGGNDTIYGGSGNDSITPGRGADVMYGEDGDDTIKVAYDVSGNNDPKYIDGGAGNDYIETMGGNDTIIGGPGNDLFYDSQGGDELFIYNLGDGNDTIKNWLGNDILEFGEGITKENIQFRGGRMGSIHNI